SKRKFCGITLQVAWRGGNKDDELVPVRTPTIYIIAGCNGAGKTTFAKEFLPKEVHCLRFLNPDELARGLSPIQPSAAAVKAARLLLHEFEEALRRKQTFALETTLS